MRPEWTRGIICDPYSPEAKALVGKRVEFHDNFDLFQEKQSPEILPKIVPKSAYPFKIGGGGGYRFIKAAPEKTVTIHEAEALLAQHGENVRIEATK